MSHPAVKRDVLSPIPRFLRGVFVAFWAMLFVAGTANAAVELRVESRPVTNPTITVRAAVTTLQGAPLSSPLAAGDFAIRIDNAAPFSVQAGNFSLPVGNLSVVFAMDYSGSVTVNYRGAMQDAVLAFIASMENQDRAAVVKFNDYQGARVVKDFTVINSADNTALNAAVNSSFEDLGNGTNMLDALILSINQFTAPGANLPPGPKAIVLISDGGDNSSDASLNDVVAAANSAGIPIFTIGVGSFGAGASVLQQIAAQTSGEYHAGATTNQINEAYSQVNTILNSEYLLTFPSSINDCNSHTIQVQVAGQTATGTFERCAPLFAPDLVGMTLSAALTEIQNLGLILGTQTQLFSQTILSGSVISHTPVKNSVVVPGSAINLVVSTGPAPATVPNVVGLTLAEATTQINGAQLDVGTVTQQSSTAVDAGKVISQSPSAGAAGVRERDDVNLVVSSGPPPVTVPNLVGSTQAAAQTAITGAGLTVGTVTQNTSATVAAGNVISHTPAAGSSVAAGTTVNLVVSSGPPAVTPTPPSGGGGGGGGGATGFLDLLAGLGLAALVRRKRTVAL